MGDMNLLIWMLVLLIGLIGIWLIARVRPAPAQSNLSACKSPPLNEWQVIDLTHPLTPTIPIWAGDPAVAFQVWASYAQDGYFINRVTIGGHSGTHWATPNTFIEGAPSAEQISVDKLVAPTIVIDIRRQAVKDQDYRLSIADIQAWEAVHGLVPSQSIVLLWTGWQERWLDPVGFINQDAQGVSHFPGFGAEAAAFLISQRRIAGLGTDTHGIDPGNDAEYGASSAIYTANGIALECLGRLDQLPATGATLVIGGLPIQGGSGSPARVFAFLPP
jgi:kynurenine formamidase